MGKNLRNMSEIYGVRKVHIIENGNNEENLKCVYGKHIVHESF